MALKTNVFMEFYARNKLKATPKIPSFEYEETGYVAM
jgi:hypothetical protein